MEFFEVKIKFENGMHARPAGLLAKTLIKYKSEILLNGENAKSILKIMKQNIKNGNTVKFEINGEDEKEAKNDILNFFN